MADGAGARPAVALLGTGIMGAAMGRNLLRARIPLRVWNRSRKRAEPLGQDGAAVSGSPAAAVDGVDVIVTSLADGPTVAQVLTDARPGLQPGQVWVQTSTVGLDWTQRLAGLARDQDLVYLDVPLLGTRQPAEQGQLTVLAAGPDEDGDRDRARKRVRPVLDAIGGKTVWLDRVGAGTQLKLVTNSWIQALTVATGETVALARGLGVDPRSFLDAVADSPADSSLLRDKAGAILGDDYTPAVTVDAGAEVAGLIADAGEAQGLHMDLARAVGRRLGRASAQGRGGDDMAAAYFASFPDHSQP